MNQQQPPLKSGQEIPPMQQQGFTPPNPMITGNQVPPVGTGREELYQQGDSYEEKPLIKRKSIGFSLLDNKRPLIAIGIIVAIVLVIVLVVLLSKGGSEKGLSEEISGTLEGDDYDPFADVILPEEEGSTNPDEELDFPEELTEPTASELWFSDYERRELFLMGMTTEEIEIEAGMGTPYADILKRVERDRDNSLKERYIELRSNALRSGSKEYQDLIDNTYLANPEVIPPLSMGEDYQEYLYRREINPYKKMPERGPQLLLRMEMDDGAIVFFSVTPERWVELPDEESMVVEIDYVIYNENEYITSIREIIQ